MIYIHVHLQSTSPSYPSIHHLSTCKVKPPFCLQICSNSLHRFNKLLKHTQEFESILTWWHHKVVQIWTWNQSPVPLSPKGAKICWPWKPLDYSELLRNVQEVFFRRWSAAIFGHIHCSLPEYSPNPYVRQRYSLMFWSRLTGAATTFLLLYSICLKVWCVVHWEIVFFMALLHQMAVLENVMHGKSK